MRIRPLNWLSLIDYKFVLINQNPCAGCLLDITFNLFQAGFESILCICD
jgi:hypothetical protein